jgi:hypothetical protein
LPVTIDAVLKFASHNNAKLTIIIDLMKMFLLFCANFAQTFFKKRRFGVMGMCKTR